VTLPSAHAPRFDASRALALAPVVMSLVAIALLIEGLIQYGVAAPPQADEVWQARVFQLLLAAELPVIAAFVITRLRARAGYLPVLAAHAALWIGAAAAAAIFFG